MAPVIKELATSFGDHMKFCTVNVDEHDEITRQFAVQHIPTFLLFKEGQVVDSIVGAVPRRMLTRKLIALLPNHDG